MKRTTDDREDTGSGVQGYCLNCGRELRNGRTDRKFCDSACKNAWHNSGGRTARDSRSRTLRKLDRNYEILGAFLDSGIRRIPYELLYSMGYSPDVVSGCRKTSHRIILQCYDLVFCESDGAIFNLSRQTSGVPDTDICLCRDK